MSRSLRHGALAATAIAFSITALSACAAGNNAATLGVRPDNASTQSGAIKVQNVNVITQAKAKAGARARRPSPPRSSTPVPRPRPSNPSP